MAVRNDVGRIPFSSIQVKESVILAIGQVTYYKYTRSCIAITLILNDMCIVATSANLRGTVFD